MFITPTLQRTGSEIILFKLIKSIASAFSFSVLSIEKGILFNDLPVFVKKTYLYKKHPVSLAGRLYKRFALKVVLPVKLYLHRNSIWYVNTIVLAFVLKYARRYKVRCILHTHELNHMFELLSARDRQELLLVPDLLIANSQASAAVLKNKGYLGLTEICHPFIESGKYRFDEALYQKKRKALGIEPGKFVWLMCGTIDHNKNPDLFIALASYFQEKKAMVKFIWVGDNTNDPTYKQKCVANSAHLQNLSWVHENGDKYLEYINLCDGFLLTSQFESFSIVTLEALALEKPVVANNCQGVSEIIDGPEIGHIVRQKNDTTEFISVMNAYMEGQIVFDKKKARSRAEHFDIAPSLSKWLKVLDAYQG